MSGNPRLNDLQLILLAGAVQREDGSIFPPPESIGKEGERIEKAIPLLLRRALVEQVPVTDRARAWREENEQLLGLVIAPAGRAVIVADEGEGDGEPSPQERGEVAPSPRAAGPNKAELVLGLLRRSEGATIAELTEATRWLPHTTRAALTGLRKKGHAIEKGKRGEVTCYHIKAAA